MKTKIQIKSIWRKVLFEYESKKNSTKKTLEQARKEGADLRGAYLRGADLRGAYLRGAYLRGADLRGADLEGAYLKGADLRGAYLRGADLEGADLEGADLEGADLRGADLRGAYLRGAYLKGAYLPIFCKWGHYIREGKIHIGCESKTPKEWIEWLESGKEFETKRGTIEFKRIEATIRAYCAYVDTMGEDLYPKVKEDEGSEVR